MRIGYSIPSNQGFENVKDLVELAVKAETLGFDGVWASEHLFHSSYIAKRLDNLPYYDPLTILTAVAMATSKVRLGTTVLVLPWHDPPRLGKTVATLDQLSDGRVDLGVGVAVTEDEFENLGVDFKTRGLRTNEILGALQALWTQETPEFQGEFYKYSGLKFSPKPLQKPYPPILIGGSSSAAIRRVVAYGDGWHTLRQSPTQVAEKLPVLNAAMEAAGRDPASVQTSISIGVKFVTEATAGPVGDRTLLRGTPDEIIETIRTYAEAGVQEMVLSFASRDKNRHAETLERIAAEIRPNL
jgi:probable F420-dependent oxidoreductase